MNISIKSLGCRLNQAELQSIITQLKELGHTITKSNEADVAIVNSCVVTHTSERKTRKLIYGARREVRQNGHVIVTGCYAEGYRTEGNTIYLSNDYKHLIPELIENGFVLPEEDGPLPQDRFNYSTPSGSLRTRINLKIQDGCDNFCSYCIIPYVRGRSISRPLKEIVNEFKALLDAGFKEFLLTGVSIGNYQDTEGHTLSDLVGTLLKEEGDYRIHFSSLSPVTLTPEIISFFGDRRLVKHLHLSLQSGSNHILKAMNRTYTRESYLDSIKQIRAVDPLFNFTTDLIVGFPGEREKDFRDSVELVKEADFSHIHTFRYSIREGTRAAALPDQVDEEIKKERSQEIIKLYGNQKETYYQKFDNRIDRVLTEKSKGSFTPGFNDYYIPVRIAGEVERNMFATVKSTYTKGNTFLEGISST